MVNKIYLLLVLPLLLASCNGENREFAKRAEKVDELLTQLQQNEQFNGGILIALKDEVLLKKAYGYADFEAREELTENTVFQCASISKTFTAAAIFKLMDEGKISLDDKLIDFFPELNYPDISIYHMLCHTSGLYPYNPLLAKNWDHSKIVTNKDIIEMYEQEQPETFFAPGEEFGYSNVAYVFLASIVEQLSGMEFDQYMEQNIFMPAGMNNTSVYTLLSEHRIENFAEEHISDPLSSGKNINPIKSGYHDAVYYLHGKVGDDKVATTLDDLWKWNRALFKDNFLGDENSRLAFTQSNGHIPEEKRHPNFDYGMGFQMDSLETYGRLIYHNGGEPGLKARFYYYPDLDLTMIMYANAYVNYIRPIREAALAIMAGRPHDIPKKSIADELIKVAGSGKDSIMDVIAELRDDTSHYYLSEREINSIAGVFWTNEMYDVGFDFLEINVELFPASVNAIYTLGEGYMETDQMDKAIPYFKEARELLLARPEEDQKPRFVAYLDQLIDGYENPED